MISRYNIREIEAIWSDQNRFEKMLQVEIALLKSLEHFKKIPLGTSDHFKHVRVNPERISEIELQTRHDVIAFCSSITEQVDSPFAKYFHFGVTSSDILDTALSLQLRDSIFHLINDLKTLVSSLKKKIQETKTILSLGRSHGMSAEPMVFAQKFLSFYVEAKRRLEDYERIIENEITGQFSGAVGNYTILDLEIEKFALNLLQLKREQVTTQVIPRDHIAKIVSIGCLVASLLERISTEVRLLHHSDIAEVSEGFKKGQKGSSTMPHKKNPISSENISGIARVIKSHFEIASQGTNLWHERDISHSSSERLMLPDHFGLLSYILRRGANLIENLEIHELHIQSKISKNFSYLSSYLMHEMILINDCTRETIYEIIQKASFESTSKDEFLKKSKDLSLSSKLQFPDNLNFKEIENKYFETFEKILTEINFD